MSWFLNRKACDKPTVSFGIRKRPHAKNHNQSKERPFSSETRNLARRADCDLSGMKYPKSILRYPRHSSQCKHHPTEKPLGLLRFLIRSYTNPGDLVVDPFAGSGTTGVACVSQGRRFVGWERSETYHEIARKRLSGTFEQADLFGERRAEP